MGAFIESFQNGQPPHLYTLGWLADYADPHNFLADGLPPINFAPTEYWDLINEAGRTFDIRRRMTLYHQADQYILEQAYCLTLAYGRIQIYAQPWVKHYPLLPLANLYLKNVRMEDDFANPGC